MSVPLDPLIFVGGDTQNVILKSGQQVKAVLIANKTTFDFQVGGFGGYGVRWLASGMEDLFVFEGTNVGKVSIGAFNTANVASPPAGVCLVTAYLKDEPLPPGNWPVSIPVQNVTVTTTTGTPTNIVNDGNAAGSQIIESTVVGDVGSAVTLTNDGKLTNGNAAHPGIVLFDNSLITSDGLGTWLVQALKSALKKVSDNAGNLLADWTITGLHLHGNPASNGGLVYSQDQTNADFTITALSTFSGTGSVTVNHNLKVKGVGVLPDIVLIIQSVAGSSTVGYASLTTTQVTTTVASGLAWTGIAIKL